jgi:hypothetical protein
VGVDEGLEAVERQRRNPFDLPFVSRPMLTQEHTVAIDIEDRDRAGIVSSEIADDAHRQRTVRRLEARRSIVANTSECLAIAFDLRPGNGTERPSQSGRTLN